MLYGGNAMLGVINIVTKGAGAYRGITVVAEGGVSPQHGLDGKFTSFAPGDLGHSYRLGLGFGKAFRLFGEDASFAGQAELYRQDGPSFEFPLQEGNVNAFGASTNYGPRAPAPGVWGGRVHEQYYTSVPTVWGKFALGDLTVEGRASRYRRATPYINYFNQLASDFDEARSDEVERWFSLDVRYQKHVGERLTVMARGYGDYYNYEERLYNSDAPQCAGEAPEPCYIVPIGKSRWAGLELQTSIDWLKNDALTTLLGADVRVRHIEAGVNNERASDGQTLDAFSSGSVNEIPWAVYLQQRYSPVRQLHLNAGARLDSDPRGGEHVSPRAAFSVAPWKDGTVKGIYSEAFRPPSYYESAFHPGDDSIVFSDLRPETVRGVEASVEQRFGAQRLLFGVYRTWWNDMSLRPRVSGAQRADGQADRRPQGRRLRARRKPDRQRLEGATRHRRPLQDRRDARVERPGRARRGRAGTPHRLGLSLARPRRRRAGHRRRLRGNRRAHGRRHRRHRRARRLCRLRARRRQAQDLRQPQGRQGAEGRLPRRAPTPRQARLAPELTPAASSRTAAGPARILREFPRQ